MTISPVTKHILVVASLAFAATLILYVVNEFTKESILNAEKAAKQKNLVDVLPFSNTNFSTDIIKVPQSAWSGLGLKSGGDIYVVRNVNETVTVIIPAIAPDGYNGSISMIVGVSADGTITGVRVIDHHETRGMGDKIELIKTPWILNFNGLSTRSSKTSQWRLKKDGGDFDQIAGATITSRAVVNQVRRVLEFVDTHQGELFSKNIQ